LSVNVIHQEPEVGTQNLHLFLPKEIDPDDRIDLIDPDDRIDLTEQFWSGVSQPTLCEDFYPQTPIVVSSTETSPIFIAVKSQK